VETVPDLLLLRKSGSVGNGTRTSGSPEEINIFRKCIVHKAISLIPEIKFTRQNSLG
jgi:hypothetical protein